MVPQQLNDEEIVVELYDTQQNSSDESVEQDDNQMDIDMLFGKFSVSEAPVQSSGQFNEIIKDFQHKRLSKSKSLMKTLNGIN